MFGHIIKSFLRDSVQRRFNFRRKTIIEQS
jgi:hypothetical protein